MPIVLPALLLAISPSLQEELPLLELTQDNTEVAESCLVRISPGHVISDADGNGVLLIVADGVVVEFEQGSILLGALPSIPGDGLSGIGIRLEGVQDVVLRNVAVQGFRCGILATETDGLRVEGAELRHNFRQRLQSTPQREDVADWLRPHENDQQQWRKSYGAGLCIERSDGVVVRDVTVREQQNGIILDRVSHAEIVDNDCSFLSGWGLAMWRSSDNQVRGNRFDFCVRGYSHGVYNRGQDSAGILMFEQCSNNRILSNSATHCGDGIFAFSGREALGEVAPLEDGFSYERRGNNDNVFAGNRLDYAVAHGLELTFGFGNRIEGNTFSGNAICGIWAGFSQQTNIFDNSFRDNGDAGYGLERGGVNIDHSRDNTIEGNSFHGDACGVHLWSLGTGFSDTPWGQANDLTASGNLVWANSFEDVEVPVHLRGEMVTEHWDNRFEGAGSVRIEDGAKWEHQEVPRGHVGQRESIPAAPSADFAGREDILLDEWGPWDHQDPLWQLVSRGPLEHRYRLLPADAEVNIRFLAGGGKVVVRPGAAEPAGGGKLYRVYPVMAGFQEYLLTVVVGGRRFTSRGSFVGARWEIRHFLSPCDPREDVESWRAAASGNDVLSWQAEELSLLFGMDGPGDLAGASPPSSFAATDGFGTIATTRIKLPPGQWKFRIRSDDGVRLWVNDELLIDHWSWHGPTWDEGVLTLDKTWSVKVRVEHFELDGFAVLKFELERVR